MKQSSPKSRYSNAQAFLPIEFAHEILQPGFLDVIKTFDIGAFFHANKEALKNDKIDIYYFFRLNGKESFLISEFIHPIYDENNVLRGLTFDEQLTFNEVNNPILFIEQGLEWKYLEEKLHSSLYPWYGMHERNPDGSINAKSIDAFSIVQHGWLKKNNIVCNDDEEIHKLFWNAPENAKYLSYINPCIYYYLSWAGILNHDVVKTRLDLLNYIQPYIIHGFICDTITEQDNDES